MKNITFEGEEGVFFPTEEYLEIVSLIREQETRMNQLQTSLEGGAK